MTTYLSAALGYADEGIPVFPCRSDKTPLTRHGFKDATTDEQQIRDWWEANPEAMIGVPTGRVSGIDVLDLDLKPEEYIDGRESVRNWQELSPAIVRTPSGGLHLWFKSQGRIRNSTDVIGPGVDTRGEGGYVIVPPSRNAGGEYVFLEGGEDDFRIADLPTFPNDLLERLGSRHEGRPNTNPEASPSSLRAAMQVIPNPDLGWDDWNKFGMAIFRATDGNDEGLEIFNGFSKKSAKYDEHATREKWEAFKRSPPTRIGAGTIFFHAGQNNPRWRRTDEAMAADKDEEDADAQEEEAQKKKQLDALLGLAPAPPRGGLFHTKDNVGYADIVVNNHRETHKISSTGFRRWLVYQFWLRHKSAPSRQAVREAIDMIEARAQFDPDTYEREVFLRVGEHAGRYYLDLCDAGWHVVEISGDGWRILQDPPARFRRVRGMLPLPAPEGGGSVEELRPFVNVKSDDDFVLFVAALLAALRPVGPYPVLKLWGEPGTSKSTITSLFRALTDPHKVSRRRPPKEARDLFIAANNAHVLSFDNISNIPPWLSDALCTLATGGGFATRTLYTDDDETLIDVMRPILLNAVENFPMRHDLTERSINIELPLIVDRKRRLEREFWAEFEALRPRILGALLGAVAHGLRMLPETKSEDWPRMADFAQWVLACEGALWPPGTFRQAYGQNRAQATAGAIDDDPVASAVRAFITKEGRWEGTTTQLLLELTSAVGERESKAKDWPAGPRALTNRLQRAKASLRRAGVDIEYGADTNRGRKLRLFFDDPVRQSPQSPPPPSPGHADAERDHGGRSDRVVGPSGDEFEDHAFIRSKRRRPFASYRPPSVEWVKKQAERVIEEDE